MDNLVIATSEADAAAATAVEHHHAQMAGALRLAVERVVAAAAGGAGAAGGDPDRARAALVRWCREELVPHALAEEGTMYPAARAMPGGRLLVDGMLGEHELIVRLVGEVEDATEPVRAAAAARALLEVFESHLAKENQLVLPLLVAAADVELVELLEGMHELLGGDEAGDGPGGQPGADDAAAGAGSCGGHTCACGEVDAAGHPELDARHVPHAIRHATVFGALDAVRPGGGMVLVAPHDPLPLLAQVEQRAPGAFEVSYLERGPESWRLQFVRRGA